MAKVTAEDIWEALKPLPNNFWNFTTITSQFLYERVSIALLTIYAAVWLLERAIPAVLIIYVAVRYWPQLKRCFWSFAQPAFIAGVIALSYSWDRTRFFTWSWSHISASLRASLRALWQVLTWTTYGIAFVVVVVYLTVLWFFQTIISVTSRVLQGSSQVWTWTVDGVSFVVFGLLGDSRDRDRRNIDSRYRDSRNRHSSDRNSSDGDHRNSRVPQGLQDWTWTIDEVSAVFDRFGDSRNRNTSDRSISNRNNSDRHICISDRDRRNRDSRYRGSRNRGSGGRNSSDGDRINSHVPQDWSQVWKWTVDYVSPIFDRLVDSRDRNISDRGISNRDSSEREISDRCIIDRDSIDRDRRHRDSQYRGSSDRNSSDRDRRNSRVPQDLWQNWTWTVDSLAPVFELFGVTRDRNISDRSICNRDSSDRSIQPIYKAFLRFRWSFHVRIATGRYHVMFFRKAKGGLVTLYVIRQLS